MIRQLRFVFLSCALLLTLPATPASAVDNRTIYVDINAEANGNGSSARPYRSMPEALDVVRAGDTIKVRPGTYPPVTIQGLAGTANQPIVIEGTADGVVFTDNGYARRYAVLVKGSRHLTIRNVTARKALAGVMIQSSSFVVIDDVTAVDTGQEGMHIQHGSHDITIQNSFIADTGKRTDKVGNFPVGQAPGEGIYVGSGRSNGGDRVWNVNIFDNEITRTNHEAIDIKAPVHDVVIAGNHIHDIRTYVSGAVVFHLGANPTPTANIVFERNIIDGVTTTSAHRDGNCLVVSAAAQIRNNVITNCEHRGIFIQDGFAANDRQVDIIHNTLFNTGSVGALNTKNGSTANVTTRNNLGINSPGNRSASASDFVSSNAGNFQLRTSSPAVDAAQPVSGIQSDLLANPRVSGERADYGAIELMNASSASTPPTTAAPTTTTPPTTAAPTTTPTTAAPTTTQAPRRSTTTQRPNETTTTEASNRSSTTTAVASPTPPPTTAATQTPQVPVTADPKPTTSTTQAPITADPKPTTSTTEAPTNGDPKQAPTTVAPIADEASEAGSSTTDAGALGAPAEVEAEAEVDPLAAAAADGANGGDPTTGGPTASTNSGSTTVTESTEQAVGRDRDESRVNEARPTDDAAQPASDADLTPPEQLALESSPSDPIDRSTDQAIASPTDQPSGAIPFALTLVAAAMVLAAVAAAMLVPKGAVSRVTERLFQR